MEKEFVPYELSLKLKSLGFDDPCFVYYRASNGNHLAYAAHGITTNSQLSQGDSNNIAAPTFSQAFRWFREKYGLLHHIYWVFKKTEGIEWFFDIKGINMTNNNILPHSEIRFETYEEAELDCLTKLIGIVLAVPTQLMK